MRFASLMSATLVVASLAASFHAGAQTSTPRPARSVSSQPAPAAAGPLRILLVDDDFSDNNNNPGDSRQTPSDRIFRQVVADAVGGNAKSWEIEYVKPYASGPGIERLRPFSVIVWYTGAIYGGNPDNSGVLSIEDEKTVRRYLQEVGGTVILFSPGYLSKVLGASGTWEKTDWKFLTEVVGARGGHGLAQRFLPGVVTAPDGARFNVDKGSAVESQFSLVNPARATVLFSTVPAGAKPGSTAAPVATSHAYGKGRFIYVGFTFENLAAAELAPAFGKLLAATGLQRGASPAVAAAPAATAPLAASVPEAEPTTVQVSGSPAAAEVRWTQQTATVTNLALGGTGQTTTRVKPKPAATQDATVKVERLVPNGAPVRLTDASPDAGRATDAGPFAPGRPVTYRVTLTDTHGRAGYKEASFTPQAKDPASLTATPQADGTILLGWPEVPGVLSYQVSGTALAAPVTVNKATEWRSPAQTPGTQQWRIASVYEPGGVLTASSAWPSVMTRVVPTPRTQYLSLPNGTGSASQSEAHYRTQWKQCDRPELEEAGYTTLEKCLLVEEILRESTNWLQTWGAEGNNKPLAPEWSISAFADLHDLGLGRRVNCVPSKGGATICWATSHGNIPPVGASVNGQALAGMSEAVVDIKSLNVILMYGGKAFFGTWESVKAPRPIGGTSGPFDREFIYAQEAKLVFGTALDSQGRKSVPHACLSCHGGRLDSSSNMVVGASLLPLIPAHLTFSSPQARANLEEQIRRINQIILESNPSPTVSAQIRALYNGTPGTPGTRANDAAVPAGWASQPGLYKQVIAPYCGSCHFSQTGLLHFGSFSNLQFNKQRVQKAVCTDFSMPHSEQGFRRFWTEGGSVSLPGLLSTVLGYPKCPQ